MDYTIETTATFDKWLKKLKNVQAKRIVALRLGYICKGHFGDYKPLGDELNELRFFCGAGYRVYYTIRNETVVLLLSGGNKSSKKSQSHDIKRARDLMIDLE